jgi:hypothetical protein
MNDSDAPLVVGMQDPSRVEGEDDGEPDEDHPPARLPVDPAEVEVVHGPVISYIVLPAGGIKWNNWPD